MSKEQQSLAKHEPASALTVLSGGGTKALMQTVQELGITQFDLQRIKIPTGGGTNWELQTSEGSKMVSEIKCVIVGIKSGEKAWWTSETVSGAPPSCVSHDGHTGIGINSPEKDAKPGQHECATCRWGQFGSARNGGKGKDCKDMMFVYLFRPDAKLPSLFVVPPLSLKPMRAYLIKLAMEDKKYSHVYTSLKLEQTKNSDGIKVSVVAPESAGALSDAEAAQMSALSEMLMGTVNRAVAIEVSADEIGG